MFSKTPRPALGPNQPPTRMVQWVISPGVKRPERETDDSLPTRAEVKNEWSYTSTPIYAFMAFTGTLHLSLVLLILGGNLGSFYFRFSSLIRCYKNYTNTVIKIVLWIFWFCYVFSSLVYTSEICVRMLYLFFFRIFSNNFNIHFGFLGYSHSVICVCVKRVLCYTSGCLSAV
jgi:hypothetical protein